MQSDLLSINLLAAAIPVCVDEKPVVLHAEVRPARPMLPGRILRPDSEYKREGTANVFWCWIT